MTEPSAPASTTPSTTMSPSSPSSPTRAVPLTMTMQMTGEHFEYLESAHGPTGRFRFRWTLQPGRAGPPKHYHPDETETFLVESGALDIWCGDTHHRIGTGETLSVPPRVPHRFLNDGAAPAVVLVTLDGTRMEDSHVPMAVWWAERGRLGAVGVLRMIVHDAVVGAGLATFEPVNVLQRGLARVLGWFGVRRFPVVERWWERVPAPPPG
jgi:mannose-6-phosphate isomerase-like protein (cupin superfamily)